MTSALTSAPTTNDYMRTYWPQMYVSPNPLIFNDLSQNGTPDQKACDFSGLQSMNLVQSTQGGSPPMGASKAVPRTRSLSGSEEAAVYVPSPMKRGLRPSRTVAIVVSLIMCTYPPR